MNTILKNKVKTAAKNYSCAACEHILNSDLLSFPKEYEVSFADMRTLVKIRKENYQVLKGTKYIYQVGIFDGDFYAVQCRLDAVDICKKYDLYDEYDE